MSMKLLIFTMFMLIGFNSYADLDQSKPRASYSAAVSFSPYSLGATDICKLSGSSSKTIRVSRVALTASQSGAAQYNVFLLKRNTLDTSNGSGASYLPMQIARHNSNTAFAGASAMAFLLGSDSGPSSLILGSSAGILRAAYLSASSSVGGGSTPVIGINWSFDQWDGTQPLILNNGQEGVYVNLQGATPGAGLSVDCNFEWNEE